MRVSKERLRHISTLIVFVLFLSYAIYIENVNVRKANELNLVTMSMENMPLPYALFDREARLLKCNKMYELSALNPLGLTKEEALGKIQNYYGKDNYKNHIKNNLEVIRTGKRKTKIETGTFLGKDYTVELIKYPVYTTTDTLIGLVANYLK